LQDFIQFSLEGRKLLPMNTDNRWRQGALLDLSDYFAPHCRSVFSEHRQYAP
jgi:hypothetical protein